MKKGLRIVRYSMFVLIIGIVGTLGYFSFTLYKERNQLQTALAKTEDRLRLVERKYSEEKTRASGLMRTKQSLEGLLRGKAAEIETLKAEKETLLSEKNSLEAVYKEKGRAMAAKVEELSARIEKIKASRQEVVERFKEKVAIIRQNEEKIAGLQDVLKRTDYNLKRTGQQLEMCKEHNSRLCTINEELVEKYKNKGVFKSIASAEPFTQLEKIEVEKLVQEYNHKIDKEKIEQ